MGEETNIKNAILDYLKYRKIFCWLTNTQGNFNKFTNTFYKNPRLLRGVSDIIGIMPDGKFLAIEVKSEKGKISDYQKEFLNNIRERNGIAFVARNIDDVNEVLKI